MRARYLVVLLHQSASMAQELTVQTTSSRKRTMDLQTVSAALCEAVSQSFSIVQMTGRSNLLRLNITIHGIKTGQSQGNLKLKMTPPTYLISTPDKVAKKQRPRM